MAYVPNLFTPQIYARGWAAISEKMLTLIDEHLIAAETPAMVYDSIPGQKSNPLTKEWKQDFMPNSSTVHFWIFIPTSSPIDKINPLREEEFTRRTEGRLLGHYGWWDPKTNKPNNDLDSSLSSWIKISSSILSRLQYGDPITGKRTLSDTCLTYNLPEQVQMSTGLFSGVSVHMLEIPILIEEAYL